MKLNDLTQSLKIIVLALVLGLGLNYAVAWVGPILTAPLGNVSAPVNISATSQYKTGALGIGGLLTAYAGLLLSNTVTPWSACAPNGLMGLDNGGNLAICKSSVWTSIALQNAPVTNGVCGSANGVYSAIAPSANLCSAGTPTAVSGGTSGAPWTWSCNGANGGTPASCSAPSIVAPYIDDVFSTYTYTGNGGAQTITNGIDLAGQGGMTWIKLREVGIGGIADHFLFDTARGVTRILSTNQTYADYSASQSVTAFNSTGFTVGADLNGNNVKHASWTFREAPKFFDVVTWTGDGQDSKVLPHNLGVTPGMIVSRQRNGGSYWFTIHRSLPAGKRLYLNTTNAETSADSGSLGSVGTASDFTVGALLNGAGNTYVAYVFAHDPGADGIIQAGSYVGNGSADGPSVTLGWEPQYVLVKRANNDTANWFVYDSMRGMPVGISDNDLLPNTSGAENNGFGGGVDILDPTATGFTIKTATLQINAAGSTYIYLAIRRPNKPPTSGTQVFKPIARAGTGAVVNVAAGFVTDLLISHHRDNGGFNGILFDRLRGASNASNNKGLIPNLTIAESTYPNAMGGAITSSGGFDTMDGYVLGAESGGAQSLTNSSDTNYAQWAFRRAPGVFDEVTYMSTDGTGSTAITHNLGVAPELIIIKSRTGNFGWPVRAPILGTNDLIWLNMTNSAGNPAGFWSGAPTESVFPIGTNNGVNRQDSYQEKYVAYLFASKAGISKVGSYTGDGTTGKVINANFTSSARYVLIKRTDSLGDWFVWDSVRGIVAGNDPHLSLNTTASEVTGDDSVDPESSGFIVNQLAATNINVLNATYIYLAFQ